MSDDTIGDFAMVVCAMTMGLCGLGLFLMVLKLIFTCGCPGAA